jgi:hypothetical protein
MEVTRGLIIDTPHIDRILSGEKTWELRSGHTKIRGFVALIRKGSGQVIGTVKIVDSLGSLTEAQMMQNLQKHRVEVERLKSGSLSKYKYAWVMEQARPLKAPIAYDHPNGAVIWVTLAPTVCRSLTDLAPVFPDTAYSQYSACST